MKSLLLFLGILSLFACKKECPEPECSDVDLAKGLLAYYPFNNSAEDASGNGNHGVLKNGAGFGTDFLGRANRSAAFDGINDYIIVNDGGKVNPDEQTISMMVLVNNVNRRHAIINKVNFENASAVAWGLGQSLDVTNKWEYGVDYPTKDCSKQHVFDPSIGVSSSENMQAGRWYHLIATFGKGKQSLYVDGILRATVNRDFESLKKCSTSQLVIGGWWSNDIISIDGKIDEIRIYNRVINECEMDELSEIFQQ